MSKYLQATLLLNLFEIFAAITGLVCWRKLNRSYWKWFVIYLIIITATELVAEYVSHVLGHRQWNVNIYIYFGIPMQFLFFCWLFYKCFQHTSASKWPLVGAGVYVLSALLEVLYFSDQKLWFSSFSYLTGNIVLLLLVLFFMMKFINSNEILYYRRSMMFWVSVGLLCFYLGTLPLYGLWNTLVNHYPNVFNTYWMVNIILDCLMYLFFQLHLYGGIRNHSLYCNCKLYHPDFDWRYRTIRIAIPQKKVAPSKRKRSH